MKLIELLLEITGNEIYDRYYKSMPFEEFKQVVSIDPKTVINGDNIQFIGKYGKMLLSLYRQKKFNIEDEPEAKDYINYLYKYNVPVDINKITSIADLYPMIKQYKIVENPSFKNIISDLEPNTDYKKVFNGKEWDIFIPITEKGACYLGVGTEWCTTYGPQSLNKDYRERGNMFNNYNKDDHLYIIISKLNPDIVKYQFHFPTKQFMDITDKEINIDEFLLKNEEVVQYFFPTLFGLKSSETEKELARFKVLPNEYKLQYLEIVNGKTENPIITAIKNNDADILTNLISDETLSDSAEIEIKGDYVWFTFNEKNIDNDIESLKDAMSSLYYGIEDSYDAIYNHLNSDMEDDEYFKETFEWYLKEYYDKNIKGKNFDDFKKNYLTVFMKNEKIEEAFMTLTADKTVEKYKSALNKILKKIEEHIQIENYDSHYEIGVNKFSLISIIMTNPDINPLTNMQSIILRLIDENDIEYSGDNIYEIEWSLYSDNVTYPGYDAFDEEVFIDFFETVGGEVGLSNLKLYSDIMSKYFNSNGLYQSNGKTIKLYPETINAVDGTIDMLVNDHKKDLYKRGKIKIKNIPNYVLMDNLFEIYIRGKNESIN